MLIEWLFEKLCILRFNSDCDLNTKSGFIRRSCCWGRMGIGEVLEVGYKIEFRFANSHRWRLLLLSDEINKHTLLYKHRVRN